MTVTIPCRLDDITPQWLTRALRRAFPGIEVSEVEVLDVTTGSASRVRIKVTSTGTPDVPESVLIKAAFTAGLGDDDLAKAWIPLMAMMHESESYWYSLDSEIVGDRSPRCYFAGTSGRDAAIVLEDLNNREGAGFGSYDRPLSTDSMASLLDVLARVHAARWDDAALADKPMRDSFLSGGMLDGFLSEVNWEQQMARPRARRMPAELNDFRRCTTAIRQAWAAKRSGPQSLIHGDPHIGNYFFDSAGAGLLDWQLLTSGHWASDVVYAVASAMTIEDRRTCERDLLKHYLASVEALTGVAPSWESAWHDYRKFAVWGAASILTPGEGVQTEDYLAVVGERHAQAALDLDSLALLARGDSL